MTCRGSGNERPTWKTRWAVEIATACMGFAGTVLYPAGAGDWPAYGHDRARSCVTSEKLAPSSLTQIWVHTAKNPPQPSWPDPARYDWYHRGPDTVIKPRVIYDRAFHVVAAGDSAYFGSSADDSVYCLDAVTGAVRWTFCTEGPVRLAPTISEGRVYFGSDDGHVYCVKATDGAPVWKYRPAPRDYRVPSDGKLISLWPVRTGVLVDGGIAYCGAGLFPSETMYLCALNADNGLALWKKSRNDLSPQGYILASASRLYVPAGRSTPVAFNRFNGDHVGSFGGGGGAYALLTDDPALAYGPGRYTGELGVYDAETRDHFATFAANHMIVASGIAYLHKDTELSALDRNFYLSLVRQRTQLQARQGKLTNQLKKLGKKVDTAEARRLQADLEQVKRELAKVKAALPESIRWIRTCDHPYSLILAGDVLFAGGNNEVAAFSAADGATLWTDKVTGKAYGLAMANRRLFVSTDMGTIHCFSVVGQTRPTGSAWKAHRKTGMKMPKSDDTLRGKGRCYAKRS